MGCFDIETNNLPFLQTVFVKVKIKFKKKTNEFVGVVEGMKSCENCSNLL